MNLISKQNLHEINREKDIPKEMIEFINHLLTEYYNEKSIKISIEKESESILVECPLTFPEKQDRLNANNYWFFYIDFEKHIYQISNALSEKGYDSNVKKGKLEIDWSEDEE